jgi:putative hydrolase of the HAD superfamily
MSIVADFAAQLHAQHRNTTTLVLEGIDYPSQAQKLTDIRAVIFDVYGTLISYWKPEFDDETAKEQELSIAFRLLIDRFEMEPALIRMNAEGSPVKTLYDLYHGLIALDHEKSRTAGTEFPEVRIERIWGIIIMMLRRHGYDPFRVQLGDDAECGRCMAYFYNFHALGRRLYPGVVSTLKALHDANIKIGILSNAQFYTALDLTLLFREQSKDAVDDYLELFESDLIFYSCDHGVSKPSPVLFRKLFDTLYEYDILPGQTIFIGNDLSADIGPAQAIGMKTAFFTGDCRSAFTRGAADTLVPDLVFKNYAELPDMISFHESK